MGAAVLILLGCRQPVTSDDLIGSYRMTRPGAEDAVILEPDGRYIHRYRSPHGAAIADTNQWRLEEQDGEQRVIFNEFLMRAPKEGDSTLPQTRGLWAAEVSRTARGVIRFQVNDDLGWYYLHEESSK
jgi:hypothetical protein